MNKPILFTGIRPTGELHLGHYLSIIDPILKNIDNYQVIVMLADLHALTELRNENVTMMKVAQEIEDNVNHIMNILDMFIGLDRLIIFKQSDLKGYHYDLFYKLLMISKNHMIFGNPIFIDVMTNEYEREIDLLKLDSNIKAALKGFFNDHPELLITGISNEEEFFDFMLRRFDISKASIKKIIKYLNTRVGVAGFAMYPILMAADIILHGGDYILVGSDQVPHLQITNELIKLLNNNWCVSITIPDKLVVHSKTIKGSDGRKMSKTLNNHLPIIHVFDEDGEDFINNLRTYSRRLDETGIPEQCIVWEYFNAFDLTSVCIDECRVAQVGCIKCKGELAQQIKSLFSSYNIDKKFSNNEPNYFDYLKFGKMIMMKRIFDNPTLRKLLLI
jgi:tryptophanyl-tRNA synthetase